MSKFEMPEKKLTGDEYLKKEREKLRIKELSLEDKIKSGVVDERLKEELKGVEASLKEITQCLCEIGELMDENEKLDCGEAIVGINTLGMDVAAIEEHFVSETSNLSGIESLRSETEEIFSDIQEVSERVDGIEGADGDFKSKIDGKLSQVRKLTESINSNFESIEEKFKNK